LLRDVFYLHVVRTTFDIQKMDAAEVKRLVRQLLNSIVLLTCL